MVVTVGTASIVHSGIVKLDSGGDSMTDTTMVAASGGMSLMGGKGLATGMVSVLSVTVSSCPGSFSRPKTGI